MTPLAAAALWLAAAPALGQTVRTKVEMSPALPAAGGAVLSPAAALPVFPGSLLLPVAGMGLPAPQVLPAVPVPTAGAVPAEGPQPDEVPPAREALDRAGSEKEAPGAGPVSPVFDGTAPRAPAVVSVPPVVPDAKRTESGKTSPRRQRKERRQPPKAVSGVLPEAPYLAVADEEDRAWISEVVAVSKRSAMGREVLRGIDQLVRRRGRPLVLDVVALPEAHGYFIYDTEIVRMDRQLRRKEPVNAGPTFVHELLHVLQKERDLPVDAFEMELEAHVVSLRVFRELGLSPRSQGFYSRSARNFQGPLENYLKWLRKEYSRNMALTGSSMQEYRAKLDKQLKRGYQVMRRLVKELKQKEAVLGGMIASGQPAEAVRHYKLDDIAAAKRRLRDKTMELRWLRRDVKLLSTPAGRQRYRAYVRSVMAMVRRFHAAEQRRLGGS